jgi:hypothetical protein
MAFAGEGCGLAAYLPWTAGSAWSAARSLDAAGYCT